MSSEASHLFAGNRNFQLHESGAFSQGQVCECLAEIIAYLCQGEKYSHIMNRLKREKGEAFAGEISRRITNARCKCNY